jgi:hypothetical protein
MNGDSLSTVIQNPSSGKDAGRRVFVMQNK